MKLVLYEWKKLISKTWLVLLIVFLVAFCLIIPTIQVKAYRNMLDQYESLHDESVDEYYKRHSSDAISKMNVNQIHKTNVNDEMFMELIGGEYFNVYNSREYRKTGEIQMNVVDDLRELPGETVSMNTIDDKLDYESKRESKNSYEIKNLGKQAKMMEESGEPKLVFRGLWGKFNSMETIAVVLFAILVIFIFAPLFSCEYTSKMYLVMQSTQIGRKKQCIYKLISIYGICFTGVVGINIFMYIIFFVLGIPQGSELSLVNLDIFFSQTPYSYSFAQYAILKMIYQSLGLVLLVSVEGYVSLLSKSKFFAALVGILALGIGYVDQIIYFPKKPIITLFSIRNAIDTKYIFYRYRSYNIFGEPVMYPFILFCVFIGLICLTNILIIKRSYLVKN